MKFKDFKLAQIVFEAQYRQGYRYLDRCGETMIDIENKIPGWAAKEAGVANGQAINVSEAMIFNFNNLKMDTVKYDVKDLKYESFIENSLELFKVTKSNLGLKDLVLDFGYCIQLIRLHKAENCLQNVRLLL